MIANYGTFSVLLELCLLIVMIFPSFAFDTLDLDLDLPSAFGNFTQMFFLSRQIVLLPIIQLTPSPIQPEASISNLLFIWQTRSRAKRLRQFFAVSHVWIVIIPGRQINRPQERFKRHPQADRQHYLSRVSSSLVCAASAKANCISHTSRPERKPKNQPNEYRSQ